jgi:hypothetical protein
MLRMRKSYGRPRRIRPASRISRAAGAIGQADRWYLTRPAQRAHPDNNLVREVFMAQVV